MLSFACTFFHQCLKDSRYAQELRHAERRELTKKLGCAKASSFRALAGCAWLPSSVLLLPPVSSSVLSRPLCLCPPPTASAVVCGSSSMDSASRREDPDYSTHGHASGASYPQSPRVCARVYHPCRCVRACMCASPPPWGHPPLGACVVLALCLHCSCCGVPEERPPL